MGERATYVFLNEAPYRTPYFPVIPTFLVRLVWQRDQVMSDYAFLEGGPWSRTEGHVEMMI